MQQLRVKDEHIEVIENIKATLKDTQVKSWYKYRTLKDSTDKKISDYLENDQYDDVIAIYEKRLYVILKQEKKLARKQKLRGIVRKLIKG